MKAVIELIRDFLELRRLLVAMIASQDEDPWLMRKGCGIDKRLTELERFAPRNLTFGFQRFGLLFSTNNNWHGEPDLYHPPGTALSTKPSAARTQSSILFS